MLNLRNIRHLFIALVFLASQWLLVVHATEHQLKADADVACQLCSIADASGTAPVALQIPNASPLESFELALSASVAPSSTQLQLPPSCGPPANLA
ncbi:hypothetical protein [Stenotrophobium rhamnosiphilum]|uniref:DUF2946 domain-containing protein n=1 Tax=Stenotrophobium rhamnosiphilum TaxID=2029166 RepID=A0A2T5MKE7_9GAMM|nr:hypothetical protein [Stenotrophobium rhamnosiphilum]PTU33051.1 hypothetical protein CJD38_02795 [Stenotrophobium rhamnosiphilum]